MVKSMEMVFNEISTLNEAISTYNANQLFLSFLHTYSAAIKAGFSRSISTPVDFNSLLISTGYYIAQWRNSPFVDKDSKMRFQGICERQQITSPVYDDCQFVQHEGAAGKGLQIACENQNPLISIPSSKNWEQHYIDCTLYDIESEEEKQLTIKNIYCEESLSIHNEWINERKENEHGDIKTPEAFLANFSILFPSLSFHRNALDQIKNTVNPINIPTIVKKLLELEKYFSSWDGGKFDRSAFPFRFVSPESEATLARFHSEHTYQWEGSNILVSYHVRYTGGDIPGRIYIYPDHSKRKCIICSLHTKLPTVNDPKF